MKLKERLCKITYKCIPCIFQVPMCSSFISLSRQICILSKVLLAVRCRHKHLIWKLIFIPAVIFLATKDRFLFFPHLLKIAFVSCFFLKKQEKLLYFITKLIPILDFLMPMTLFRNVLRNYSALEIKQHLMKYICPFSLHWVFGIRKKRGITTFCAVKNCYVPGKHKIPNTRSIPLLTPER